MARPALDRETDDATRRIVPWVISIGLHAALIAMGFLLTWTVVRMTENRDPVLIIAEFDALSYDPVVPLRASPSTAVSDATSPTAVPESLQEELEEQLAELAITSPPLQLDPAGVPGAIGIEPDTATFVGLTTSNARHVVYVIDASGSMIQALPIVVGELAKSLSNLSPQQRFAVIFFQRNQALTVPPGNRLQDATPNARAKALAWIGDNVNPAGRSNPLAAIAKALSLDPDVIFLLSENITGSGRFEIDQEDLLALLDELNPIDAGLGRRRTQINCVQFLDPDPLDTLRIIAERHGGPDGYRFLSRSELGLAAP